MKSLMTLALVFISLSVFSQQDKPKADSVKLTFSIPDLQTIYVAVDNTHADHMAVKRLLEYIKSEFDLQTIKKDSSTNKKP